MNTALAAPRVSVLLPVYNGGRYLAGAIESILNQSYRDFELLIVNDGSTDGSAAVIAHYQELDGRIRVHTQPNQGFCAALNNGLALVRGEYIARMDADDVSLPERLVRQVAFLDDHPEVGVLGGAFRLMDEGGQLGLVVRFPAEHNVLVWLLLFCCPLGHPTVMMRSRVVRGVSGYDPQMAYVEDYDLWRRLKGQTRFSNLPETLLHYRQHVGSFTDRYSTIVLTRSLDISQALMGELLGCDVSREVVRRLWTRELESVDQMREASQMIYRTWRASDMLPRLSPWERELLRRYVARRIFGLIRPRLWHPKLWPELGVFLRLDPCVGARVLSEQAQRVFGPKPSSADGSRIE
jgi:glycosyltransferase involved in cell wall biosynthesis